MDKINCLMIAVLFAYRNLVFNVKNLLDILIAIIYFMAVVLYSGKIDKQTVHFVGNS